jgi:hypothetical protein
MTTKQAVEIAQEVVELITEGDFVASMGEPLDTIDLVEIAAKGAEVALAVLGHHPVPLVAASAAILTSRIMAEGDADA